MNYSDMSDFEINKRVADALGEALADDQNLYYGDRDENVVILINATVPDYCNNPSDAWPIIFENKINIEFEDDETITAYHAPAHGGSEAEVRDKKPLRAAMVAFLMMKDEENANE